ncbi:AAC(3) family N-acetyltransferase [Enterovibrio sp. ZSDZ35]|uniref:Aminoglycoside N(3)-acetyltransferase n=1 Tax=Enterovibrio qingdaonensis TaxID=2899818 RepID=A0ABT5QK89_9GAMM|nr:AAC(3) family N-acetyltransferase [Enterovibrio sp. ZSDZ35]MDD1781019.1 AAC(3) family N-acetyltransferase [Enterovibrio sp. ZSDZ35]
MSNSATNTVIKQAISALGLTNKTVFIHCGMRSFTKGKLDTDILISAFLDAGCTIVVPTFNYDTLCLPPEENRYLQNGHRGEWSFDVTKTFVGDENIIEPCMGSFARDVLNHPNRVRSQHPISSFAALGPNAQKLIKKQTYENVYGLYQGREAKDAFVLSIGVTLNSITPIHYAEELAGRTLFRRWAKTADNDCVEVCVGSCSNGFANLASAILPISTSENVLGSQWTAYPLEALLEESALAILATPMITHCDDESCPRCEDMTKGGLIACDVQDSVSNDDHKIIQTQ